MCVSLECVSISHLSPFRKLTLLATQDPLRPFCLELIKYVTINEPFEDDCDSGRYWGIDAPLIDGSDEQHDVWYVDFSTPLKDFMLQPRSGDADALQTPLFDTMVDDPAYCLVMLGEALHSECAHDTLVDETAWVDVGTSDHAASMLATFLWNAAPWRSAFRNPANPTKTLVLTMPPGDPHDVSWQFRDEWGAIYVKALEAWWRHIGVY